jgi:hypothetical protein
VSVNEENGAGLIERLPEIKLLNKSKTQNTKEVSLGGLPHGTVIFVIISNNIE